MQIYLLRSPEYAQEQFDEVLSFLNKQGGPARFMPAEPFWVQGARKAQVEEVHEEEFFQQKLLEINPENMMAFLPQERAVSTWEDLFAICQDYRAENQLPKEAMVILLTEVANNHNWFSALDPQNTNNGFVHSGEWQYYIRCSGVYPVAYLVASLILQKHMFRDYAHLQQHAHAWPLGCINDFCGDKKQIILKLRTADICFDCMQLLKGKLDISITEQMLRTLEGVRSCMLFHQNFRQNLRPSTLEISRSGGLSLPEYNKEISLFPLEKVLYLFFLNHPEGVRLKELVEHKAELAKLYERFASIDEKTQTQKSIDDLVSDKDGLTRQKMNRISKKFKEAVGEELAKHYIISGERGGARKIALPRHLLIDKLIR